MRISAVVHSTEYRGDHSADVEIAVEAEPGDTLEQLFGRASLAAKDAYHEELNPRDYITLRLVAPSR